MKYIQLFEEHKHKDYKGKTDTYRLSDIHYENNKLVGTCKGCNQVVEVTNQEHSNPCKFSKNKED